MPQFHELIDQERPLRILAGILTKGNIPHAFLFTGIDGIGKRTAAIHFAMVRNCQSVKSFAADGETGNASANQNPMTPCGQCNACVKIMAGSHPDVIAIEPEGDVIKIARIRELSRKLAFKPREARARVVIISDAQAMNLEASNALLKALEEPPPQTFFFLTAGQTADLLPTVVSRCQHIRFHPVAAGKIERHLIDHCGLTPPAAKSAAVIADGSVSKALALSEKPASLRNLELRRQWLATEIVRLPSRSTPIILMFAQKLAADKNGLSLSLEIIKRFLRDAAVGHCCPERTADMELREVVEEMAGKNILPALLSKISAVEDAEQAMAQHANPRLTLEVMALRLADMTACPA